MPEDSVSRLIRCMIFDISVLFFKKEKKISFTLPFWGIQPWLMRWKNEFIEINIENLWEQLFQIKGLAAAEQLEKRAVSLPWPPVILNLPSRCLGLLSCFQMELFTCLTFSYTGTVPPTFIPSSLTWFLFQPCFPSQLVMDCLYLWLCCRACCCFLSLLPVVSTYPPANLLTYPLSRLNLVPIV